MILPYLRWPSQKKWYPFACSGMELNLPVSCHIYWNVARPSPNPLKPPAQVSRSSKSWRLSCLFWRVHLRRWIRGFCPMASKTSAVFYMWESIHFHMGPNLRLSCMSGTYCNDGSRQRILEAIKWSFNALSTRWILNLNGNRQVNNF